MKSMGFYKWFALSAIAFFFIATNSCEEVSVKQDDGKVAVSGIILDQQGLAVPHALIIAKKETSNSPKDNKIQGSIIIASDTTNEDGEYELEGILDDFEGISIQIIHEDFKEFLIDLDTYIQDKDMGNLPFYLQHQDECCGFINISIGHQEEPVNNAVVQLKRENKLIRKAKTNDYGIVSFESVCSGDYYLRIVKDGFDVIEKELNISDCDSLGFEFSMVSDNNDEDSCCNGSITINPIDDETEELIKGAKVILYKNGKAIEDPVVGDKPVTIEELCKGEYAIVIIKEGYKTIEEHFDLECNENDTITLKMKENDCCNGVINFKVIDEDENGINEVKVRLWQGDNKLKQVYTNDQGVVTFKDICEGEYQISFFAEGFDEQDFSFGLDCNDTLEFIKTLKKQEEDSCCDGVIKVYPFAKGTDDKIKATVKLRDSKGNVLKEMKSYEGEAIFTDLCQGEYEIVILHEAYLGVEIPIDLDCNEEKILEKGLSPKDSCCNGTLKIIVKNKDGEKIKSAKVKIYKNGNALEHLYTNEKGEVVFDGLCKGKYGIDILHEQYDNVEFEEELGCNEEKIITKELGGDCCNGYIKFIIRDNEGNAIKGAKAKLYFNGSLLEDGTSAENGKVIFDGLCDGKYAIVVEHEDFEEYENHVELDCNEEKIVEINLGGDDCCEGKIEVHIRDSENEEAIKGATVKLWQGDKKLQLKSTNENGGLLFENICEGDYHITVEKEGFNMLTYEFDIGCDKEIDINKLLVASGDDNDSCCTASFRFLVKDKSTYEHLEGVKVRIWLNGDILQEGETNPDGIVEFGGICNKNSYGIDFIIDGYKDDEFSIEISKCKDYQETIKLEKQ